MKSTATRPTHTINRDPNLLLFLGGSLRGIYSLGELICLAFTCAGRLGGHSRRELALGLGTLLLALSQKSGTGNNHSTAARYVRRVLDLIALSSRSEYLALSKPRLVITAQYCSSVM